MGKESLNLKALIEEMSDNFCVCDEHQKQNCREPLTDVTLRV